ncbi:MAG: hypothetical protein ACYDEP_12050 [Acidimicrobiales bacterium]
MSDQPVPIPTPRQTPLFHSLEQPRYVRQGHLREIQERTGNRVIAYIGGPVSSIDQVDIPSGGDVDQAERLVMMCRKKIGPDAAFRVVVADSAKSAGTLIPFVCERYPGPEAPG